MTIETENRFETLLREGLSASAGVVSNWERGDLAGAVNALGGWADSARGALDTLDRERDRETSRAIDDKARKLVESDVLGSVSHLVSKIFETTHTDADFIDEDEAHSLAWRPADADDFEDQNDAASYGGKVWRYIAEDGSIVFAAQYGDDEDQPDDREDFDDALEAWQWLYEETGQDAPEGCEALEHWLVTDWLARRLRNQGESVVDCEALNLTIWARCTSGQAVYCDAVFQRIARDMVEGV